MTMCDGVIDCMLFEVQKFELEVFEEFEEFEVHPSFQDWGNAFNTSLVSKHTKFQMFKIQRIKTPPTYIMYILPHHTSSS